MFKNVDSQKVAVFAWDNANSTAKTGDAGNITSQISIDGAATAATNDTNPTELDATDAPGIYIFDMTQAETNGDLIVITPVSSTSDIVLRPVIVYTQLVASTGALSGVALNTMIDRIYTRLFHEVNVTDATGAVAIRNSGDSADIATGSITDDDTTTTQAKWSWA